MLKTIEVKGINIKAAKEGIGKNNKPYKLWPIGINVGDYWLNGAAFNDKDLAIFSGLKNGDRIELEVFEEEWNGKPQLKFKLPSKEDRHNNQVEELTNRIEKLEKVLKAIVTDNKLIFHDPDKKATKPAKKQPQGKLNGDIAQAEVETHHDETDEDLGLPF